MKKINDVMLANILNHQIKFLENTELNEILKENWQEKYTTFAAIRPLSTSGTSLIEGIDFGHIIVEKLFLFTIRFLTNLNSRMRISFKTRQFEIKRIINVREQDRVLEIVGLEITN